MRILIVGAGALGGLVGAFLTRAGEDVTLFDITPGRARLLSNSGLTITQAGVAEPVTVPVAAVASLERLVPFDLIFIAVKSYQTASAVEAALPATHAGTIFLSMQNGVGNCETIARLVGATRVICGLTYHSAQHGGPGRIQFRVGIKPIQIAPFEGPVTPALQAIGDMFDRAGLATTVVPSIDNAVWEKLLHNAVVNPVSAITGLTCRELLGDEDLLGFMRDLCDEVIAVMRARGTLVTDPEDPFRPVLASLHALGANRPSMWQDLLRGVRTEVDALNGAVVAEAERFGVPVPYNRALVRFIHSRERHKFLDRQAINQMLGLGASAATPIHTASGAFAAHQPGYRLATAPITHGLPLESTRRLHELVHAYYRDLGVASDTPQRKVAYCSALAPVEIARAFGMTPFFPENHAAIIAATHQSSHYLARASAAGFSQFASSAMRVDLGALIAGTTPLTGRHGLAKVPRPDLVIYSTNSGDELVHWFEQYADHYRVPMLGLRPPLALDQLDETDRDAADQQQFRLIAQLERSTGRELDLDRLSEVVANTAEAARLWGRILDLASAVPAPITMFDMAIHMAPMVLLRGTPEAVDYYRLLMAEVEERVAQCVGAVPDEVQRFYWEGPPIWYALRPLAELFAAQHIAVPASTYCANFTFPGLDPDAPIESLAQSYATTFNNLSGNCQNAFLADQFIKYRIDATMYHDSRTGPDARHVRAGVVGHTECPSHVPALVIEADSHDERLLSLQQLQEQVIHFMEQRLEREVRT